METLKISLKKSLPTLIIILVYSCVPLNELSKLSYHDVSNLDSEDQIQVYLDADFFSSSLVYERVSSNIVKDKQLNYGEGSIQKTEEIIREKIEIPNGTPGIATRKSWDLEVDFGNNVILKFCVGVYGRYIVCQDEITIDKQKYVCKSNKGDFYLRGSVMSKNKTQIKEQKTTIQGKKIK